MSSIKGWFSKKAKEEPPPETKKQDHNTVEPRPSIKSSAKSARDTDSNRARNRQTVKIDSGP